MNHRATEIQSMNVSLQASRAGLPEPQLELRLPPYTRVRVVMAELHKLACEVELETPDDAGWGVHLELDRRIFSAAGRVFLELLDATEVEAARGMATLRRVMAAAAASSRSKARG
jgi:hypothetical protein